jgi:hypothetical protein
MPWKPVDEHDHFPTLGWYALDWIYENLTVYDGPTMGEPLSFTQEQAGFILRHYEVDPKFEGPATRPGERHMRRGRIVRRSLLSRPKGWGKSPLVAAMCLLEACGDIVMDGWDANGQPVGRPWSTMGFKPLVQIVAVSEDQTANTWMPCIDMARNSPIYDNYSIEPMETFIAVTPEKGATGRIEAVTSAGLSREGFRPVFTAMDQTESWIQSNGGHRLARTIRRNTMKTGGSTVETPNAFEPGEESIAEQSWNAHQTQLKGKNRSKKRDLYLDHREAPATTDIYDEDSLRAGLLEAYGDSASDNGGWVNIDGVIDEFWDENTDPQEARRYFLNQITHASDSYLSAVELAATVEPKPVQPGTPITLGFDGSEGRTKGKADATALVACRLSDGYCWQVLIKEPPNNPKEARSWTAPVFEFDVAVGQMFRDFKVVGFYADPSGWEAHVANWEKLYGRKLKVRGGGEANHPIMAWPRGKTTNVVPYVKRLKASIIASGLARTAAMTIHKGDTTKLVGVGEFTYDGSHELTQHLLNARMRKHTTGYLLAKDFPESPRKIDGAYALVLAWKARLDALAKGLDKQPVSTRQVVTLG